MEKTKSTFLQTNKIALFAGSFDPISLAHLNIVDKIIPLFSKIYFCISQNAGKINLFSAEQRTKIAQEVFKEYAKVTVVNNKEDLTAIFAKKNNVSFLIRGLKSDIGFANEYKLANINKEINSNLETIIIFTDPKYMFISSTIIRELVVRKLPIDNYVPKASINLIKKYIRGKELNSAT